MWEKLKALSQHPVMLGLKKFCGDPVQLYSVFLIMTAMHYYHEAWSWLYTLLALAISFVLMRFYDFVASKRFLGPICYLAYMALGLYATSMITVLGQKNYPISFFVWFLTPQSVVDFSLLYTIAIYMLMLGFITSAVYYFAKVRYRMVMQLVIMMIPLSLYAKEDLHMPALLVILLLSSYFLLMVYCRQLKENQEVCLMDGFHSGMSIVLYVAAFSVIAAIIPKPQFKADREFIDNAMSYSTWSDVLMNAISMFTESTNNTIAVSNNTRTLYYVQSPCPLRLRTQTYTYYKGENDSWNAEYIYDRPDQKYTEPLTYQPRALTQAILDAAKADADFAGTYNLTDVIETDLPPQQEQKLYLYAPWARTPGLPNPSRMIGLQNPALPGLTMSGSGIPTITDMPERGVWINFYADTYARYEQVLSVLTCLHRDTYDDLLRDAAEVLQTSDPDAAALLTQVRAESKEAGELLAYSNACDYSSDVLRNLAAEITEGEDSDIGKALAIERYFSQQEYVYDLSYKKETGDNVDTFLTSSHTGVCYEFATAMTLLCRNAGLPTRFVQGYNLTEEYSGRITPLGNNIDVNYVIKMRDAHAFPEVYISGYGWVSFEPTVSSFDMENSTAENLNVTRWGYVILALTLLGIGIWAILPYLRENSFRRRLPGMAPDAAASAAFIRMRRTLHLEDSVTVLELKQKSTAFFAEEPLFTALDTLLYDPTKHTTMTSSELAETYIRWQAQRKVYEKEEKKLRKEQKKHHVNA